MRRARVEYLDRGSCCYCGNPPAAGLYGKPHTYKTRGYETTTMEAVCAVCFQLDLAEAEAVESGARYTEIRVGARGSALANYFGERCPCGNVALQWKDWCPTCWRETRMLDKNLADAIYNRRLLNQLKEALKCQKSEPLANSANSSQ